MLSHKYEHKGGRRLDFTLQEAMMADFVPHTPRGLHVN